MNKTLTLYILASLAFVAASYAGEPGQAMTQLAALHQAEDTWPPAHPDPMPEPVPYQPSGPLSAPWDSPWTSWEQPNGSTEDCYMEGGVEICIAPNWPDCNMNGDVEPCIDHVQTFCPGEAIPTWVSFTGEKRWHQGCYYPSVYYPEASGKALLLRAEEKNLSVLLRGRKVSFAMGGAKKRSSRGYFTGFTSETWWEEFFENDPCHGLMACYNQANADLLQELLNEDHGDPYGQWSGTEPVTVGQAASGGVR